MADDNPFNNDAENPFEEDNPFANPSTYNSSPLLNPGSRSEDFNFGGSSKSGGDAGFGIGAASGGASQLHSQMDLNQRIEELKGMDRELKAKEAALKVKEVEIAAREAAGLGPRPPNWPSCAPVLHHDIPREIPLDWQGTVRAVYYVFLLHCFAYVLNFICQLWALAVGHDVTSGLSVILSAMYVLAGPPFALYMWYLPLYTAVRRDKASRFVTFFLFFFIQIGLTIFWMIGLESTGGSGVIVCIDMFQQSKAGGGVIIALLLIWFILVLTSVGQLKTVHSKYRGRGGDLRRDARAAGAELGVKAAMATA